MQSHGEGFELTNEGRSYALRMIRVHRLWERYLADETGLAETEWHRRAEKLEHNMTEQEAEALAASAGHRQSGVFFGSGNSACVVRCEF